MKKFLVSNIYRGTVEIVYGKKTVCLKSGETIVLNETELASIPKHKKYLIGDFITVSEIEEK